MGQEQRLIVNNKGPAPFVNLRRIQKIDTYEIMESELEAINDASERESLFLAFFCLCFGGLVSSAISILTADWKSPMAFAATMAISCVLFLGSLVLGGLWVQARKIRPRLIDKIKQRAGVIEQEAVIQ